MQIGILKENRICTICKKPIQKGTLAAYRLSLDGLKRIVYQHLACLEVPIRERS